MIKFSSQVQIDGLACGVEDRDLVDAVAVHEAKDFFRRRTDRYGPTAAFWEAVKAGLQVAALKEYSSQVAVGHGSQQLPEFVDQ